MAAESKAGDVADRAELQGFLSKYLPFESDALKTPQGDYDKFITPNLNHMNQGHGAEHVPAAGDTQKLDGNVDNGLTFDDVVIQPTAHAQDPMALASPKEETLINTKDFDAPKIAAKEEARAVEKMFANGNNTDMTFLSICAGLLSLVMVLGRRKLRELQEGTVLISSSATGSDMSINMAAGLGDNITEMTSQGSVTSGEAFGVHANRTEESLPQVADAATIVVEKETSELVWKGVMLFVTIAWATNFAITAYACENISQNTGLGAAQAAAVFVVLRFAAAAASTAPWLLAASSKEAAIVGAKVGGLYALGYGAQAAALAHGFPAANAAFVCSLQCVAVALLGKGTPAMRTMVGLVLAISGVACLELLGANGGGSPDALGLALALGQPLAFGASYVVLEKATRDHPNDALAMTALQCVAIFCSGIAALSAMEGGFDVALSDVLTTWNHLDGQLAASVAWTGIVSTSFTIWLCTQSFKHLSSVDASLILTSEPLWAAVVAAALLGEHFSAGDAFGGLLILLAVAINDGLIKAPKGLTMAPNQMLERRSVFSTFKNTAMAGASLVVADKAWASIAEPTQSAVASAVPNKVARQILQIERLNVDSNGSGDRKTHKPRLEISGNSAKVCIDGYSPGEGDQVKYIWLKNEEADAIVAAKEFPEDFKGTPVLSCSVTPGRTYSPCAYFTVHGLWLGRSETA